MAWVERGAELCREDSRASSARLELTKLQCDLLAAIGRTAEALAIAWGEFERHPSQYTYADLMRFVAEPDRADWHGKAMEATRSADLHTLIDLLIAAKEIGRLADLIAGTPDQAFKMPATSQQNPRPSPWKNPTRNWPPGFGGPKECGSSMQGKASTTAPPWKTSRVRNVATSVRVSPPSGNEPYDLWAIAISARQDSFQVFGQWFREPIPRSRHPFWIGLKTTGAEVTGVRHRETENAAQARRAAEARRFGIPD